MLSPHLLDKFAQAFKIQFVDLTGRSLYSIYIIYIDWKMGLGMGRRDWN